MIEQDPRITEGPTFFTSLYAWMKRAAQEINSKAPLNSPALTGSPTAPTPPTADNSTRIATTAWVRALLALGFVFSTGTNWYFKLPTVLGGFVIQGGTYSGGFDGGGGASIVYPLTFPNSCLGFIPVPAGTFGSTRELSCYADWGGLGLSSGFVYMREQTGAGAVTNLVGTGANVRWVAFGF